MKELSVQEKNEATKLFDLLELRLQALREDIPRNLVERKGDDLVDLELFDMRIAGMQSLLRRGLEYNKTNKQ